MHFQLDRVQLASHNRRTFDSNSPGNWIWHSVLGVNNWKDARVRSTRTRVYVALAGGWGGKGGRGTGVWMDASYRLKWTGPRKGVDRGCAVISETRM